VCAVDHTEAPSIPSRPEVVDSGDEFIFVKWNRPMHDGGAELLGYNIERRDPGSNRWVILNTQLLTVVT